jgi:peptide-methionine (S)-S-oxide reductase
MNMIGDDSRSNSDSFEVATLGGGCFWCLDAVFNEVEGIESVVSGYSGGTVQNPSYERVCSGSTGHAEVVQLRYDPDAIPYQDVLRLFFSIHNPTTLNRQGADVGTQYRSVIFYHDDSQRKAAEEIIGELAGDGIWADPIVTEIKPSVEFYEAEVYHQDYYSRNGQQPYCQAVIAPKLAKFRKQYITRLKKS